MKVYNGPDFSDKVSELYSVMLNIFFLACSFGIGIPILFPIGIIIFANVLFCQKIRVAYICQHPNLLDDSICQSIFSVMKFAPLFMLFNAYWMLDNHQIFGNQWSYIGIIGSSMRSKHYFGKFHICQSSPLGYALLFVTVIIAIKHVVNERILLYFGFGLYRDMIQIWEDLP